MPAREPSALSGGERQRVALARALASRPSAAAARRAALANVDVAARAGPRELLIRGAPPRSFGGATVLVAHDPLDALDVWPTGSSLLDGGTITQAGTPDEIRARPSLALRRRPGRREPVRRRAGAARGRGGDAPHARRRDHGLAPGRRRFTVAARSPAAEVPSTSRCTPDRPTGRPATSSGGRSTEIAVDGDRARSGPPRHHVPRSWLR